MGNKRRRSQPEDAAAVPPEAQAAPAPDAEETGQGNDSSHPTKKARVESSRSLFVRSLPPSATDESVTEFFSQHFPVKHATVILDPKTKASRGYGFVTFTDADDAKEAKEKLQKAKMDGRPLLLEMAEHRHRQGAAAAEAIEKKQERQSTLAETRKAPKLIVRNLPWSIKTSDQLAALFRSYGKVKFADLPQSKGKLSGFGFVTLRGHKNAETAIEGVNGKTVDGRTLAVDWAVEKKQWEQQQGQDEKAAETPKNKDAKNKKAKAEEEEQEEEKGEKDGDSDDDMDEDLKNFMKNHMQNLEDEDSKDEDEDEDEEGEEPEDDDEEDGEENTKGASSVPAKTLSTDNSTTLFIRNLPFTTTDEQLKSHFEQFGAIRYARIVIDRAMDRPAGTGFVCFVSEPEFKACLKGAPRPQQAQAQLHKKHSVLQDEFADPEGKYTIEGRILQVTQAVSKGEATRLAETGIAAREGRDKDKRRLYLLAEGTIPTNSPLHEALTPAEVQMREQSAAQRKKMIQSNPSLHLSLTRLAVRNLPRDIDSKALKALARQAVVEFSKDVTEGKRQPLSAEEKARGGEADREAERRRREKGKGLVRQTKVVFENKQGSKVPESDGAGRSRGYGFIEYTSHRWALMGLRWLNGHALQRGGEKPGSGKTQRLIVEFAIENAQVVQRRQEQQARALAGHAGPKKPGEKGARDDDAGEEQDEKKAGKRKGLRKFSGNKVKGGVPKSKDFSVSKGQRDSAAKRGKRIEGGDAESKTKAEGGGREDALQQKIIARKRMVRKKKAHSRSS